MTPDILAPLVRIFLRWAGGYLIAKGFTNDPNALGDPELIRTLCFLAAGVCGLVSEGWYVLARKYGWTK